MGKTLVFGLAFIKICNADFWKRIQTFGEKMKKSHGLLSDHGETHKILKSHYSLRKPLDTISFSEKFWNFFSYRLILFFKEIKDV